ncbi:MAG TPA: PIN domain-containing protein [Acidimicrobiales bacterium]|nr:PIN domain-containing protein [Acidimicrobiales bacterium]
MIIVDASVMVTALADDGGDGRRSRLRLRGEDLAAPHLIDYEVMSAWRHMVGRGSLDAQRVESAMRDLQDLDLERAPMGPLHQRCWELRSNLTVYDAAYIALAEATGSTLLTADTRLSRTPGIRCAVEILY